MSTVVGYFSVHDLQSSCTWTLLMKSAFSITGSVSQAPLSNAFLWLLEKPLRWWLRPWLFCGVKCVSLAEPHLKAQLPRFFFPSFKRQPATERARSWVQQLPLPQTSPSAVSLTFGPVLPKDPIAFHHDFDSRQRTVIVSPWSVARDTGIPYCSTEKRLSCLISLMRHHHLSQERSRDWSHWTSAFRTELLRH